MKPFDPEAEKRGEPVVTRDGRPARILHVCQNSRYNYPLVVLIGEKGSEFSERATLGGRNRIDGFDSSLDLFMAPKKRTAWVAVGWKNNDAWSTNPHSTEQKAIEELSLHYVGITQIQTRSFEFEE